MRILSRTTSIASLFLAVILSAPGFAASALQQQATHTLRCPERSIMWKARPASARIR